MSPLPSDEYLIDKILPKHEIHLLAGPSGAGKSRWLFDNLLRWEAGESVLGYPSYPVPWVYVSCDRSTTSVRRTLTMMQIDPDLIPLVSAWDPKGKLSLNAIRDSVDEMKAELIVWEGFGSFVDPPATGTQVKAYLARMHDWINADHRGPKGKPRRMTLLGVVESPKLKPHEKYENPRQRVSGVAAWAHYTETIMLVEFADAKKPSDPQRKFILCPRNGPGAEYDLEFDKCGHLRHKLFYE
jgi:hypothetical protein